MSLLAAMETAGTAEKPQAPALYLLADNLTGNVRTFIDDRRNAGRSWRRIASDLKDDTGGLVDVTHETVRRWYVTEVTR